MTLTTFEESILDVLRSYWRIRSSMLYLKHDDSSGWGDLPIEYHGIFQCGVATNFLVSETLAHAINELDEYACNRLTNDLFLSMISYLERFLSDKLSGIGRAPTGTFGNLQMRAERAYRINGDEIDFINEIRERRNSLIHHSSQVTAQYRAVCNKAVQLYPSFVRDPNTVTTLDSTPEYLSFVAHSIIQYSRKF